MVPEQLSNIFDSISCASAEESFADILTTGSLRIERIVSRGHSSSEGFWYQQEQSEWVIVLSGSAKLRFDGDDTPLEMKPGDFINIPAHKRHRVEWTTPDKTTVWLAVHYSGSSVGV